MSVSVKICGITTPDAMTAAIEGGADMVGLVFHESSPRHLDIEVAAYLANYVPAHVKIVGLFVDPHDRRLFETLSAVRLDMIQLHGAESPARVREIREKFGQPVMKAIAVSGSEDLKIAADYQTAADWLALDARGTPDMPGGNGATFDWSLLKDFKPSKPWMLAGGLTPDNVAQAIRLTRPGAVDVSSGVEASRGVKDVEKIRAFLAAARISAI